MLTLPQNPTNWMGFFSGVVIALTAAYVFALVLIPSLLPSGARIDAVGKALYCYLMQGLGVLLMSVSGLLAVYGVFGGITFSPRSYLAMLIVFSVGGVVYLWHEGMVHPVDPVSKSVPALLYHFTFKLIGFLVTLLSALTILFILLFAAPPLPEQWWIAPVTLLLYGLFVSWVTRHAPLPSGKFQSTPTTRLLPIPPPATKTIAVSKKPATRLAKAPSRPAVRKRK